MNGQTQTEKSTAPVNWQVTPFRQEAFIENKGQYEGLNNLPGSAILFGLDNWYKLYFTPKGMTWRFENVQPMTREEEEEYEREHPGQEAALRAPGESDGEAEEHERVVNHPVFIHLEWIGANPGVEIITIDPVSEYFTFADPIDPHRSIDFATAYKKIIYKNLYPGIDVEYVFKNENGSEGIKYSIIVHPGADPSVVKMRYTGADVYTTADGILHFRTEKLGEAFSELAPQTFYTGSGGNIGSAFSVNDNVVSFGLENYDASRGIIIDPWQVVTTTLTTDPKAFDITRDAAGNSYVAGGLANYKLQKYSPTGAALWTYTSPYAATGTFGDIATDPAGNTYFIDAFESLGSTGIVKISTAGAQLYYLQSFIHEQFHIVYNPCNQQLFMHRFDLNANQIAQLANVNPATGAQTGMVNTTNSEYRSLCAAPNGNIYGLTCQLINTALMCNVVARTNTFAANAFGSVSSGYVMPESGVSYSNGQTVNGPGWAGQNGICADNCFIYTFNGLTVNKRNKTTGAVVATVNVPGGLVENNSGIAVDSCGNVYVGSQVGVYKYDFNLVQTGFSATNNPVYCITTSTGGEVLACGRTFAASIAFTACNPLSCSSNPTLSFNTVNPGCTSNNGSATVNVIGASGPYTYAWSNGQNTQTATNLAPGTYTCTVTAACNTITGTVTISPPLPSTANISNQSNVTCPGGNNGSATVMPGGGQPPYTYAWTPTGGNAATANNLAAGTYTCLVTDANGCTATATVTITSPPAITASVTTVNTTCGNNTGSATVAASGGTPGYTYMWNPTGQTTATASNLGSGVYNCTVTDALGCTQIFQATITNSNGPVVTLAAQQDVSCPGGTNGSATLNVNGGSAPYTYVWSSGGNGATESNLAAGSYTCTVTDSANCVQGFPVTITEPPAYVITSSSTPTNCNPGNTGTATVNVSGANGGYSYNWSPSGGNSSTATGLTAGTYTCYIIDSNFCPDSAMVTITSPSNIAATTTQSDVTCNGGTNGSATANPSGGSSPYTYNWTSGGTNPTETNLAAGTYNCTVTDASGCAYVATVTITEPPAMTMNMTHTDVSCNGANDGTAAANATGGNGGNNYTWLPNGANSDSISGLAAGTYTCTVTDMYGCAAIDSVTVTEPTKVEINVVDSVLICQGQSTTINATVYGGNPGYSVTWSPSGPTVSPATTTTYTVSATDTNGCASVLYPVTVVVSPALAVLASGSTTICDGASVPLSATGSGGDGNYTYSWASNTTPASGQNVSANPNTTTTYTVVITDGCGSAPDSSTVTVNVNPNPTPTFVLSDTAGCAPFCITFVNNTPNSTSCAWLFGDGGYDTTSCTPSYCYANPGIYDVQLVVTDTNGCVGSTGVNSLVSVYASPSAGFAYDPLDATMINPQITFADQSQGGNQWLWYFGTGDTSTFQNPTYVYADTGMFNVMQVVYNGDGCTDTAYINVSIEEDAALYIPNAFTPDGDGMNDLFLPVGIGVEGEEYEFWIFDRWGNLIFHSTTWGEGWDGKVQGGTGEIAQQDVYVWKLQYRSVTKKQLREYMGHVSLVK
jgi:gliding motility-associated-like protein